MRLRHMPCSSTDSKQFWNSPNFFGHGYKNKLVSKLELSKNNFNKNCASKILFLIEKNQNVS